MKNYLLFLLPSALAFGVAAQPVPSRDMVLAQRRAELRTVLQTPRPWQAPDKDQANELTPENLTVNRRLTEQERADLRQQLRLQRGESSSKF